MSQRIKFFLLRLFLRVFGAKIEGLDRDPLAPWIITRATMYRWRGKVYVTDIRQVIDEETKRRHKTWIH